MRLKRKRRIRAKIVGTAARPRLVLYRSNRGLFAQVIDDGNAVTLAGKRTVGTNIRAAIALGEEMVKVARETKISAMVFDRSGYRYHGVIAAFVDAVRQGGIMI